MPNPSLALPTPSFAATVGDQPFTLLDADLKAIVDRINATASDFGGYAVRGLVGQNDAGAPNTKFGYSADLVQLRNPTDNTVIVKTNTGTLTNDVGLAGPVVNGRDQVAAFGASTWIHFYFIWNGVTLGTLSSLTGPPTGPTLPTGYTHWAYACSVRFDSNPFLVKTRVQGTTAYFENPSLALSAGTATIETAVSLSSFAPPNAVGILLDIQFDIGLAGIGQASAALRIVSGVAYYVIKVSVEVAGQSTEDSAMIVVPNLGQQVFYLLSGSAPASGGYNITPMGYLMPNGGP